MKNLTQLFRLVEITRSQPQYGYALSEIAKGELSDLAQHQYLVAFMTWRLCRLVNAAGASVNTEKALEFALIHDLGELFGGDIAMPYGKANPKARRLAKAFEAENHRFLSQYFDQDSKYFKALAKEILAAKSNESLIAKIADYMECTHYKLYMHKLSKADVIMVKKKIDVFVTKMKDKVAKKALSAFADAWAKELTKNNQQELFATAKLK